MTRTLLIVFVTSVVIAGCAGGEDDPSAAEPTTTAVEVATSTTAVEVATSMEPPTPTQPAASLVDDEPVRTLTVTGEGTAYGVPDTLTAELVVTVLRPDANESVKLNAQVAANVRQALLASGVDSADIQSSDYTIHSEYYWSGPERRFEGMRVRHSFRVKLDPDTAGETIDAAVAASWDALEITGTWLSLADDSTIRARSRIAALENCLAVAEQVAASSDTRVGELISLTVNRSFTSPLSHLMMGGDGEGDTTSFEPGRIVATTEVVAIFELET